MLKRKKNLHTLSHLSQFSLYYFCCPWTPPPFDQPSTAFFFVTSWRFISQAVCICVCGAGHGPCCRHILHLSWDSALARGDISLSASCPLLLPRAKNKEKWNIMWWHGRGGVHSVSFSLVSDNPFQPTKTWCQFWAVASAGSELEPHHYVTVYVCMSPLQH